MNFADFSVSSLFASFIFGVIGTWLFSRGRKMNNYPWVFIALALIIYTFFTKNPWQDWGIGIGLCALAYRYRYWD